MAHEVREIEANFARRTAYRIRAELVCCTQFHDLAPLRQDIEARGIGWGRAEKELFDQIDKHGSGICYWGEAAALLVEELGGVDHAV